MIDDAELSRFRIEELEAKLALAESQQGYLEALHRTALALMGHLDIDALLETILKRAGDLLSTPDGFLHMRVEDGSHMRARVAIGAYSPYLGRPAYKGEGVTGTVWETKQCVLIRDYDQWEKNAGRTRSGVAHAIIGVPLLRDGEVIGVFALSHADPQKSFPEKAEELMVAFAQLASIALDNALKMELIERQSAAIRELEVPVIEVWRGVLVLPLVGMLDSRRVAEIMNRLLAAIVEKKAEFAVLDMTGIEVVDTSTAAHLFSLVGAARLLGAEGIITGLRPSVAQTMIALGIELQDVTTLSNLRHGLAHCIERLRGGARPLGRK